MRRVSKIQQEVLEAMEYNRWYRFDELPLARGQTYLALERKGLIEAKQYLFMLKDIPHIWSHLFKKVDPYEI